MNSRLMTVVFLDADTLPLGLRLEPAEGFEYRPYLSTGQSEVASRIQDADVVITNKVKLDADTLARATRLRLVCVAAAGTDNVDVEAAARLGIAVRNVPDYGSDSVAEHVIATLFALRRQLLTYAAAALDGRWCDSPHFCWNGPRITDLGASTFGIVGRGRIGEAVARLARGLGMQVRFAQSPGQELAPDELPWGELIAQSDALSLHVPLTLATRGMIDERSLAGMKANAILVNTGRGALVDATALANALTEGRIAGAAIDVLETEPPPRSHPLLDRRIPNLLLTPHVAWASERAQSRLAGQLVEIIKAAREERPQVA